MITYAPLADVRGSVVENVHGWRMRSQIGWVALRDSEVRLSAHYYPLGIRWVDGHARLGAIVDDRCHQYPLVGRAGDWQGAYQPVELRCFPFRLKPGISGGSADDIEVAVKPAELAAERSIPLRQPGGSAASPELAAIVKDLKLSHDNRFRLSSVLDLLTVSGVLSRVAADELEQLSVHAVDVARLDALDSRTLVALTRSSLMPIEVAVAMAYSQRLLRADLRRALHERPLESGAEAPEQPNLLLLGTGGYELDDSELYSYDWLANDQPDEAAINAPTSPGTTD